MEKSRHFEIDAYKHWIEDHVRFSDLDAVGHVNNNSISQYFENARAYLYGEITPEWPRGAAFFVLAHAAVDFHKELHMPARLKIGTGILKIGRTSMTIVNALFHEDAEVASSESVSVYIDRQSRQPMPVPDEVRTLCERYMI